MNAHLIKRHLLISIVALLAVSALAQERTESDRLHREAQELIEKARDLKAKGDLDGAEKLGRAAKDLQHQADQPEPKSREGSTGPDMRRQPRPEGEPQRLRRVPGRPQDGEQGRPEKRPEADNGPRERMDERRSDERDREQRSEGLRIERRESRRFESRSERLDGGERPLGRGERLDGPSGPRAEQFDLAVRRYHVRKAIWHLHAAGLHAQADRLQERLEEAIQRFQERRQDRRRPPLPHEPRSDRRPEMERNDRP